MSYNDFRAYLKKQGSNPEIDSFYYELSSHVLIHGIWNCEVITLGFVRGEFYSDLIFRPKDESKPIVFGIDGGSSSGCHFIVVDAHLDADGYGKMGNYSALKTDDYLIDCSDRASIGSKYSYWSVKKDGLTFVYMKSDHPGFSDTYQVSNLDWLCGLVGGDITANDLRAITYKAGQKEKKENRREEHIQRLQGKLSDLREDLKSVTSGSWPFIMKKSVDNIIDEYNQ